MSSAALTGLVGATALAVDIASLYVERRHTQGAVDLAAIAGASDIPNAEEAIAKALRLNKISDITNVKVVRGRYHFDLTKQHSSRFTPNQMPYNAVRVSYEKTGKLHFGKVFNIAPPRIQVDAVATRDALATFSVGSRLLAVREGVINSMSSQLFGSKIELTAMDYQGLLKTDIQLVPLLDALATEIKVDGNTYADLLSSKVRVSDLSAAMLNVAKKNGQLESISLLTKLNGPLESSKIKVPLRSLLDIGPLGSINIGDAASGWNAKINALKLAMAAATVGHIGKELRVGLDAGIPGIAKVEARVAIGEPLQKSPWLRVGAPGSIVRTTQMRIELQLSVGGDGALAGTALNVPIIIDAAYAQGRLSSISCDSGGNATVQIAARSGIVNVMLGKLSSKLDNFSEPPSVEKALLVKTPLAKIFGTAAVDAGNHSDTQLTFSQSDINAGTIKRTSTTALSQGITSDLFRKLSIDADVAGLNLGLGNSLSEAVGASLGKIAAPLDSAVFSILTSLGVFLGEADIRVHGARCGSAVLTG